MKNFAYTATGVFFSVATLLLIGFSYLVVTEWQPYWRNAFDNFIEASGHVPHSIERLNATAQTATEVMPLMLVEMQQMNTTMSLMDDDIRQLQGSVGDMNQAVKNLSIVVPQQMGVMNHQMGGMTHQVGRMRQTFSPAGMMPWNW